VRDGVGSARSARFAQAAVRHAERRGRHAEARVGGGESDPRRRGGEAHQAFPKIHPPSLFRIGKTPW
jgi:hypothetical protein